MSSSDDVLVCRLRSYATGLRSDLDDPAKRSSPPVSLWLNIIELLEDAANNIEKRRSSLDETARAFQNQGG